jgi:hypothetical protein
VRPGARASSVTVMEHTDTAEAPLAEFELLLWETDREDPILPEVRHDVQRPVEDLNSQILAGLVSP